MHKNIGFIGLGVMGSYMATHLIKQYKFLHILDRNSLKTKKFIRKYKKHLFIHERLDKLSQNCSYIITCVGNDKDLKSVFLSKNGILNGIKEGTNIIDHTTASPKLSKDLFKRFMKKKSFFFDAPMSGGEAGAKFGELSIMIGGDKKKINNIYEILEQYSKSIIYMGKSGSGQLTKMVNQICVAAVIQGLAEGLNFAKQKKLNINNLVNVIKNGAGQSWQLENRAKTMWNDRYNFGFMNTLMLKDLNLIFNEITESNIKLPITKIIKKNYKKLVNLGYGKEDTSNLIRLLR